MKGTITCSANVAPVWRARLRERLETRTAEGAPTQELDELEAALDQFGRDDPEREVDVTLEDNDTIRRTFGQPHRAEL